LLWLGADCGTMQSSEAKAKRAWRLTANAK
jgi:hypothetical protein